MVNTNACLDTAEVIPPTSKSVDHDGSGDRNASVANMIGAFLAAGQSLRHQTVFASFETTLSK